MGFNEVMTVIGVNAYMPIFEMCPRIVDATTLPQFIQADQIRTRIDDSESTGIQMSLIDSRNFSDSELFAILTSTDSELRTILTSTRNVSGCVL